MASKLKILMAAWIVMGFLVVPLSVMAQGYPPGNDHAVVGVPGGWKASLEASKWSTSGSLASRLPKGNDRAVVGVPKGWVPK